MNLYINSIRRAVQTWLDTHSPIATLRFLLLLLPRDDRGWIAVRDVAGAPYPYIHPRTHIYTAQGGAPGAVAWWGAGDPVVVRELASWEQYVSKSDVSSKGILRDRRGLVV